MPPSSFHGGCISGQSTVSRITNIKPLYIQKKFNIASIPVKKAADSLKSLALFL
jgi:hypothetical protein